MALYRRTKRRKIRRRSSRNTESGVKLSRRSRSKSLKRRIYRGGVKRKPEQAQSDTKDLDEAIAEILSGKFDRISKAKKVAKIKHEETYHEISPDLQKLFDEYVEKNHDPGEK